MIEAILIMVLIIGLWEIIKLSWAWYCRRQVIDVFTDFLYFDAAGTTPMCQESIDAMINAVALGNASTDYATQIGIIPNIIDEATYLVRSYVESPNATIIFNSGASEGNCYSLRCIADTPTKDGSIPHIILSSTEHKSSLMCVDQLTAAGRITVTYCDPDYNGVINPMRIAEEIRPNTRLISIIHTNNETGAVAPVAAIGKIAARAGVMFHVDCTQSFSKIPIQMCANHIDFLTASAHKFYGPTGVGILALSPRAVALGVSQIGGTQFGKLRGGTENIPGIASTLAAMRYCAKDRASKNETLYRHKLAIVRALANEYGLIPYIDCYGQPDEWTTVCDDTPAKVILMGSIIDSSPNTLLLSIIRTGLYPMSDRFCNVKLKQSLFDEGVIISIGSACNTKSSGPSHVLKAIRAPYIVRSGTIRISMLDTVSEDQVQKMIKILITGINRQLEQNCSSAVCSK